MADTFKIYGSIFIDDKSADDSLSKTSKKFNDTFDNTSKKASTFATNIGKAMTTVGTTMVGVATTVGGAAMKLYIPFEESATKVSTLASDKIMPQLKKDMITLSNTLGTDATKIGDAMYQGLSSGVSEANISDFTLKMGKLAKGGMTEVAIATDLVTTILNSYGLEINETSTIMDRLIQMQNKGKTTVAELGASMGKVIPTANAFSVDLDNVGAAYALMTSKGIATAENTTYLNSAINEMGKSGTKSSEVIKKLSGKSFPELMKEGKSLGDVFAMMDEYAKSNNLSLADLFQSSEAGKAALVLAADGGKQFNEQLKGMQNSTGEAEKAFNKMDDTLQSKINKTIQAVKNSFIKLGEALLPVINEQIVPAIEKFADYVANLDENTIENIGSFVKWTAIIGGATAILGPIVSTIGNLIPLITNLTGGITASGSAATVTGGALGGLGGIVSALINPWTLLIGTVTGLGVAFAVNQESIKKGEEDLMSMGDACEDFTGRIRTEKSLWTKIFGENIKIQFSENLKTASVEASNATAGVKDELDALNSKINEILNDEGLDPTAKLDKILALYDEKIQAYNSKLEQTSEDTIKQIAESTEKMYNDLRDSSAPQEAATNMSNAWREYAEDSRQVMLDNNAEITSIYEEAKLNQRKLTEKENARILELEEQNAQLQVQLTESTTDDKLAILAKEENQKYIARKKEKDESINNNQEILENFQKFSNDKMAQMDQEINKINQLQGINTEDKNAWIANIEAKRGALTSINEEFTNNIQKYKDVATASKNTMETIVAGLADGNINVKDFGMTQSEYMGMAVTAMMEAGIEAQELTDALLSIPDENRVNVLTEVFGTDDVEIIKQKLMEVPGMTEAMVNALVTGQPQVEEVTKKIKQVPNSDPKVTATTTGQDKVENMTNAINNVPNSDPKVTTTTYGESRIELMTRLIKEVPNSDPKVTTTTTGENDVNSMTRSIRDVPNAYPSVNANTSGKGQVDDLRRSIESVPPQKTSFVDVIKRIFTQGNWKGTEGFHFASGTEGLGVEARQSLVGEQGPEIVDLPRGAKVKTHRETRNIMNNQDKAQIIQVAVDGKVLAQAIAPYTSAAQGSRNRQLNL